MNENNNSKTIRQLAALSRAQLIGKYGLAIFVTLLITTIELGLTLLTEANVITSTPSGYLTGVVISIIVDLLLGILVFGQANFYLKIARGSREFSFADLFRGLKGLTDKTILVQSVFTGFSVLALIPSVLIHFGIIYTPAEYYYYLLIGVDLLQIVLIGLAKLFFGLSVYLLADNPDWSVSQIFKESLYRMKNKKGKLLLTYLSTLPLLILSIIPCGIGVLWFTPYFNNLMANFYLDTIGEEPWAPKPYGMPPAPTEPPKDDSPTLDIRL